MKKRELEKLMVWVERTLTLATGQAKVSPQNLFYAAFLWKYHRITTENEWRIRAGLKDYHEKGLIPQYVEEFVQSELLPSIVKERK